MYLDFRVRILLFQPCNKRRSNLSISLFPLKNRNHFISALHHLPKQTLTSMKHALICRNNLGVIDPDIISGFDIQFIILCIPNGMCHLSGLHAANGLQHLFTIRFRRLILLESKCRCHPLWNRLARDNGNPTLILQQFTSLFSCKNDVGVVR
ncbi:hypothetical protein D3C74_406830 [compost metagenome]